MFEDLLNKHEASELSRLDALLALIQGLLSLENILTLVVNRKTMKLRGLQIFLIKTPAILVYHHSLNMRSKYKSTYIPTVARNSYDNPKQLSYEQLLAWRRFVRPLR